MAISRRFALFFVVLVCSFSLFAQAPAAPGDKGSYAKNFEEGNAMLDEYDYMAALQHFLFAYRYDSTNANINYLIGQCYLRHPTHKHYAEQYLERAIKDVTKKYRDNDPKETQASIMAFFFLGQSYHLDGRLDEATKMYDTYESYLDAHKKLDREDLEFVEHFKKQVANARRMMMAPVNVKITNLGDSINTEWPEYSPVISADEQLLFYTTRRPTTTGGQKDAGDGMYFEDIMVSYKDINGRWGKSTSISPFINTDGNEATINITPDGQTLIIYRDDAGDGNVYYSNFDGKMWGIPIKYGSDINTEYWETHATLSRDGNTLYFVSDRPGGLGGRDIYKSVKLPNGQWSLSQNIGPPINTPYDEDAPFMGADGITFYFASTGDHSMGGFDIMFSYLDEKGKFAEPVNMGYPINTTDDDVFYVATPDNKRFYLSSGHEEIYNSGVHEKGFGEKDIYMGEVDIMKENPLALFRGRFVPGPCDSLPEDISVTVSSISTGEIVGTYRPNRRTGTFSIIIPPGSKYHFSYEQEGNELASEDVFVPEDIAYEEIQKAINIPPIKICPGAIVKEDTARYRILLNVSVFNNKRDRKPVAGAVMKMLSRDVADRTDTADAGGRVTAIPLQGEKSYELGATLAGSKSEAVVFNTIGIKKDTTIEKELYLEKAPEVAGGCFTFYFSYNKNEVDVNAADYKEFIDKVAAAANGGVKISLKVNASASYVPTRQFRNNAELAATRANATLEKIKNSLNQKGIAGSEVKVVENKSFVSGPAYKGDFNNSEKYGKYQYVKVCLSL